MIFKGFGRKVAGYGDYKDAYRQSIVQAIGITVFHIKFRHVGGCLKLNSCGNSCEADRHRPTSEDSGVGRAQISSATMKMSHYDNSVMELNGC